MTGIEEVADVVTFFRAAFSVIYALALAEGFKQTVHDKADKETDRVLYPEKVIGLLSFLLLILPFYQGAMRIYGHFYGDARSLPPNYSVLIIIDSGAFLIEAAIFFYMSRALSPAHWTSFYKAVLALLWFDTIWVWLTSELHTNRPPESWGALNLIFGALALLLLQQQKKISNNFAVMIGCIGLVVRTVLDYYFNWSFYFPPLSG